MSSTLESTKKFRAHYFNLSIMERSASDSSGKTASKSWDIRAAEGNVFLIAHWGPNDKKPTRLSRGMLQYMDVPYRMSKWSFSSACTEEADSDYHIVWGFLCACNTNAVSCWTLTQLNQCILTKVPLCRSYQRLHNSRRRRRISLFHKEEIWTGSEMG
ncbi:hypothetical protein VTN96DRAFT_3218 [Rasamsonia emersonii]